MWSTASHTFGSRSSNTKQLNWTVQSIHDLHSNGVRYGIECYGKVLLSNKCHIHWLASPLATSVVSLPWDCGKLQRKWCSNAKSVCIWWIDRWLVINVYGSSTAAAAVVTYPSLLTSLGWLRYIAVYLKVVNHLLEVVGSPNLLFHTDQTFFKNRTGISKDHPPPCFLVVGWYPATLLMMVVCNKNSSSFLVLGNT